MCGSPKMLYPGWKIKVNQGKFCERLPPFSGIQVQNTVDLTHGNIVLDMSGYEIYDNWMITFLYAFGFIDGFYLDVLLGDMLGTTDVQNVESLLLFEIFFGDSDSFWLISDGIFCGAWIFDEATGYVILRDATGGTCDCFFVPLWTVDPTCVDDGYTIYECTECGEWYNCDFTEPLGHSWTRYVLPATCVEYGYAVDYCDYCDEEQNYQALPPTGHYYDIDTIYQDSNGNWWIQCMYCDDEVPPTDAEFLESKAANILRNGLTAQQLHLSANNNAVLTLLLDGKAFVLATGVNNRNVSGSVLLPDDSGVLVFDIRGNGTNVREFRVVW